MEGQNIAVGVNSSGRCLYRQIILPYPLTFVLLVHGCYANAQFLELMRAKLQWIHTHGVDGEK